MGEPQDELVALTQRSMMDANEGRFDAAAAVFAQHAVFDVSEAGIGRFEGRDAVRGYLEDWIGAYERQDLVSWEGQSFGAGVVFVVTELEGRPAGTEATVRERWAFRVRWEAGAIVEVLASQDVQGSRAAAEAIAAATAAAG